MFLTLTKFEHGMNAGRVQLLCARMLVSNKINMINLKTNEKMHYLQVTITNLV